MAGRYDKLLAPRSIAVLGASDVPERPGGRPFQLMRHSGYVGQLVGVHPTLTETQGCPCYPSVTEIPFVPDLAIIALNTGRVLEALEDIAAVLGDRPAILAVQARDHPGHQCTGMAQQFVTGKTRRDAIQNRRELRLPPIRVYAMSRGDPAYSDVFTNCEQCRGHRSYQRRHASISNPYPRLQY